MRTDTAISIGQLDAIAAEHQQLEGIVEDIQDTLRDLDKAASREPEKVYIDKPVEVRVPELPAHLVVPFRVVVYRDAGNHTIEDVKKVEAIEKWINDQVKKQEEEVQP